MKRLIAAFVMMLISLSAFSQNNNVGSDKSDDGNLSFSNQVMVGFNVGASFPLPIPNRMSGFSWTPPFTPYIGYKLTIHNDKTFGMATGLMVGYKGMHAKASVYQIYTEVVVDGIETKGYFTGRNSTNVDNLYMSFPIEACILQPKYRFNVGVLLSYTLKKEFNGDVSDGYLRKDTPTGDKILVSSSSYNFDDEVRGFDIAATLTFERKIVNNLNLSVGLDWSLTPLLHSDFTGMPYKLYNVYAHVGVVYGF